MKIIGKTKYIMQKNVIDKSSCVQLRLLSLADSFTVSPYVILYLECIAYKLWKLILFKFLFTFARMEKI